MGTRSEIAYQDASSQVHSILCNYDGYPEYVGKILFENYNNLDRIADLVNLGNLSCLGTSLDSPPKKGVYDKEYTIAYSRDYHEADQESNFYKNEAEWLNSENQTSYQYLFKDNTWYLRNFNDKDYQKLEDVLNLNKKSFNL